MYYDTSIAIEHVTSDHAASRDDNDKPHTVLEVRMRFCIQLMSTITNNIVYESPPVPLMRAALPLPVHEPNDDDPILFLKTYIADKLMLEALNIPAPDIMVDRIASYVLQLNKDTNVRVTATVDNTYRTSQLVLEMEDPVPMAVVLVPTIEIFRMEELEENGEEELGSCCICWDEIDCEESDGVVVRIPCGHVYHKSCLSDWLYNSNSCPLCRTPLPIDQPFMEFIHEDELSLGIGNYWFY